MPFTLTLLGTDTQFSKMNDTNAYDKVETLSYISSLIENPSSQSEASLSTEDKLKALSYRNENAAVIDGPTTYGNEIGNRIALGVLVLLEAVSRGEKNISIIAHSRGAVEAILVAHELERIQSLGGQPDSKKFLFNSVDINYTKVEMLAIKTQFEALDWVAVTSHLNSVKISILNIDPVPGGNFIGVTIPTKLAWRDPRFYEVPQIVTEYEQYVYENERTRCFKVIVPKCASPTTKFKLFSLPGHHGTGSGNLSDQQRSVVVSPTVTHHVQELVIVKLIDFLNRNGVRIVTKEDSFSGLIKSLYSEDRINEDAINLKYTLH